MYMAAMANNIDEMTEELLCNHYPLHYACMVGDEPRVRELLSNGCFDIYQEDGCRAWTPVHWAAFGGHWKCLAVLSEKYGVFMDIPNNRFNQTPTHIAAMETRSDCIAWLVQHSSTLGSQLGCLREVGHQPGSLELRSRQTGETASHLAALEGHSHCLHWLIQRGNGYSLQDHLGETPLHKAARLGNLDCVKLLTPHTAALSIYNHSGKTALDLARQGGYSECAAFLEQALCSQHSSFFPTSSSPILMNGEGIYQCQKVAPMPEENGCDQDMEMGDEVGARVDVHPLFSAPSGVKRSFDDDDETSYKRPRLFAPCGGEKMGTATNNNIISSYNAVLAMSAEPTKPHMDHSACDVEQAHATQPLALPCLPYPSPNQQWKTANQDLVASSSFQDHCSALSAQIGYDSFVLQSVAKSDHGS